MDILNFDLLREGAHGTVEGEYIAKSHKIDSSRVFVQECWRVIHNNKEVTMRAITFLLKNEGCCPRIPIEDLKPDLPKTYSRDLSDSDFPRSEVLHNIANHMAKYNLID